MLSIAKVTHPLKRTLKGCYADTSKKAEKCGRLFITMNVNFEKTDLLCDLDHESDVKLIKSMHNTETFFASALSTLAEMVAIESNRI